MARKLKSNAFPHLPMIDWGHILLKLRYSVSGIGMWSIAYSSYFTGPPWTRAKAITLGCMGTECMRIQKDLECFPDSGQWLVSMREDQRKRDSRDLCGHVLTLILNINYNEKASSELESRHNRVHRKAWKEEKKENGIKIIKYTRSLLIMALHCHSDNKKFETNCMVKQKILRIWNVYTEYKIRCYTCNNVINSYVF